MINASEVASSTIAAASEFSSKANLTAASSAIQEIKQQTQETFHEKYNNFMRKAREIHSRLHYLHCIILLGLPIAAVWALFNVELQRPTFWFSVIWYWITGLGITAGYHRFYAHKSYEIHNKFAEFLVLMAGTGAMQGSCKWWSGGHRIHHRYTDTQYDPYNSKSEWGLFYSHFGWMLVHPKKENQKYADISDLNNNKLVAFQHKYYGFLAPFVSLVLPTLIAGLFWGDWLGGYFYAGVIRQVLVHHSTFCVNSIAHYLGDQTFDDQRTPRDSLMTALLTFGEGLHNFHHEFPNDYRNGIQFLDYDPTKWLINALNWFGIAKNLKMFPKNEIDLGMRNMKLKAVAEMEKTIQFPTPVEQLPALTYAEMKARMIENSELKLTVINNIIYNISEFISSHPGGRAHIASSVGVDATRRFLGLTGIYKHSNAASNLLESMRYARIVEEERKPILATPSQAEHAKTIPASKKVV